MTKAFILSSIGWYINLSFLLLAHFTFGLIKCMIKIKSQCFESFFSTHESWMVSSRREKKCFFNVERFEGHFNFVNKEGCEKSKNIYERTLDVWFSFQRPRCFYISELLLYFGIRIGKVYLFCPLDVRKLTFNAGNFSVITLMDFDRCWL